MRVVTPRLLRGVASVSMVLLLTGCWDYSMPLPGGWVLERWAGGEYVVFKTETGSTAIEVLVGPTVKHYRVIGHLVTGRVEASDYPGLAQRPTLGYFVVDTATDRVWQGLDEAAWRERLREVGITEEPRLKRPSVWDVDRPWHEWARR